MWPGVLDRLKKSNIEDFTIYYSKEVGCLFSHFVYVGTDWDADMAAIAEHEETRRWWAVCDACQQTVTEDGAKGSVDASETGKNWWTPMEELFHQD